MDKVSGDLLGFKIGSAFVPCEMSCDINIDVEVKSASTNAQGGWNGNIYGNRGWSASLSANLLKAVSPSDINTLMNAIMNRATIQVELATSDAKFRMYGTALVTGVDLSASAGEFATYNGRLIGDGQLTFVRI